MGFGVTPFHLSSESNHPFLLGQKRRPLGDETRFRVTLAVLLVLERVQTSSSLLEDVSEKAVERDPNPSPSSSFVSGMSAEDKQSEVEVWCLEAVMDDMQRIFSS